jgi:hypothetical protein
MVQPRQYSMVYRRAGVIQYKEELYDLYQQIPAVHWYTGMVHMVAYESGQWSGYLQRTLQHLVSSVPGQEA